MVLRHSGSLDPLALPAIPSTRCPNFGFSYNKTLCGRSVFQKRHSNRSGVTCSSTKGQSTSSLQPNGTLWLPHWRGRTEGHHVTSKARSSKVIGSRPGSLRTCPQNPDAMLSGSSGTCRDSGCQPGPTIRLVGEWVTAGPASQTPQLIPNGADNVPAEPWPNCRFVCKVNVVFALSYQIWVFF